MIDVSNREIALIKKLLDEVKDGAYFCIGCGEMCGHDISDIENQLIVDILSEYVEGESNGKQENV